MKSIHLIMPMAGEGSRFAKNGILEPKPLIMLKGRPFFYWATMSILKDFDVMDITFVVLDKHIDNYHIDKRIIELFPNAKVHSLDHVLEGPVHTCVRGLEEINDNEPIIFNDCDHMFRCVQFADALKGNGAEADAVLMTFQSSEPQYSYVEYSNGEIIGTVEKKVVSNDAICGAYFFESKSCFLDAANKYINNCEYSECFMSGVYNVLHKEGKRIERYDLDYHLEFGTPSEFLEAENSTLFGDFT